MDGLLEENLIKRRKRQHSQMEEREKRADSWDVSAVSIDDNTNNDNKNKSGSETNDGSNKASSSNIIINNDNSTNIRRDNNENNKERGGNTTASDTGRDKTPNCTAHTDETADSSGVFQKDTDNFTRVGSTKRRNRPRTNVHMSDPTIYKYPVILQDDGTGTDLYKNYNIDTNRLWTRAKVGAIKCQRECGGRGNRGGKWIIECCSREQQLLIAQTTALKTDKGTIKFTARIPEERTEGVVSPIPLDFTVEEIAQLIHDNRHINVNISGVTRLKNKSGERSKAVRIVFYSKRLPEFLQVGTQRFKVEPYRREVKRCTRCQRLDHEKKECRSKRPPRCPKCLEDAHPNGAIECKLEKSQWRCVNCNKKGHSSAYGGCPEVLMRKKAMEIQAKEYMPYASALARAKKEINSKQTAATRFKGQPGPNNNNPVGPSTRERLVSSSPVRQLNYAAAARVGVPNVSIINKNDDHVSFLFKRTVPKMASRPRMQNLRGQGLQQEKNDITHEQEKLAEGENNMMEVNAGGGEHTQAASLPAAKATEEETLLTRIEKMMMELEDRINRKIEKVAQELRGQQTQPTHSTQTHASPGTPSLSADNPDVVKKCLDVLECVRQAALGNVTALMDFVLSNSPHPPNHTRIDSSKPVPEELRVALSSFAIPVPGGR